MIPKSPINILCGMMLTTTISSFGMETPNLPSGMCDGLVISGERTSIFFAPEYNNPNIIVDFEFSYSCTSKKAILVETLKDIYWNEGTMPDQLDMTDGQFSKIQYAVPVQKTMYWSNNIQYIITDSVSMGTWLKEDLVKKTERTVDIGNQMNLGIKYSTLLPLFATGYGFQLTSKSKLQLSDQTNNSNSCEAVAPAELNDLPVEFHIVFNQKTGTMISSEMTYEGKKLLQVSHTSETESSVKYYGYENLFRNLQVSPDLDKLESMIVDCVRKTMDSPQLNSTLSQVTVFDRRPDGVTVKTRTREGKNISQMRPAFDEKISDPK